MGTPEFAVPSLKMLADHYEVVLAVTRPDAVRGRGKTLEPSCVKACAQDLGIEVLEAKKMTEENISYISSFKPDLIVVAAYGCILPQEIIDMAPYGCINVHASLLPRWRGAAPIQRAIMAGDERVGVSIMQVVKALDAGDYCAQASCEVADKSCDELMDELADLGAKTLIEACEAIFAKTVQWTAQDESQVTLSPKVSKKEMRISSDMSAASCVRYVQGSTDMAPCRISIANKGLRIMKAALSHKVCGRGEVIIDGDCIYLGTADGSFQLLSVKPDGKRQMDASVWARGLHETNTNWSQI